MKENLEIRSAVLGQVSTNCYILKYKDSKEALIIDPADRSEAIINILSDLKAEPKAILLTHGHFDHIGAANELKKRYQIPIYAHRSEDLMLRTPEMNMTAFYGNAEIVKADVLLEDLQEFTEAGIKIRVYHTPGHTRGGCCYFIEDASILLSGDTLFCGSVGRTDFPGGSMREIKDSIDRLIEALPEETEVYPGHGEATTIGYEKRYNPFV